MHDSLSVRPAPGVVRLTFHISQPSLDRIVQRLTLPDGSEATGPWLAAAHLTTSATGYCVKYRLSASDHPALTSGRYPRYGVVGDINLDQEGTRLVTVFFDGAEFVLPAQLFLELYEVD